MYCQILGISSQLIIFGPCYSTNFLIKNFILFPPHKFRAEITSLICHNKMQGIYAGTSTEPHFLKNGFGILQ